MTGTLKEGEYSGRFSGSINEPAVSTIAPPTVVPPSPEDAPAGDPPVISTLTPATGVAGATDTMVTVDGTDFTDQSTVAFDGAEMVTTYVSETQLMFDAPTSTAVAGDMAVTVRNGDGQTSVPVMFAVTAT